jgi:hypothetical protein
LGEHLGSEARAPLGGSPPGGSKRALAGRGALLAPLCLLLAAAGPAHGAPVSDPPAGVEPSLLAPVFPEAPPVDVRRPPPRYPPPARIVEASEYAAGRQGLVSFTVLDDRGRLSGLEADRDYSSASVVKALLLVAELRRLHGEGLPLDDSTAALLRAMITYSDNDAADAIYGRVGDSGLHEVAAQAGMGRFEVAGYWGNARITAADMARFMARIDRPLPSEHREVAHALLAGVVPAQRWGIPAVADAAWHVELKGGWRPSEAGWLSHQAAALRRGPTEIELAVLTDAQPSAAYANETQSGIAARLLSEMPRRPPSPWGSARWEF